MTYVKAGRSPGAEVATQVAGGILAGGASRRMGGQPKALLSWPPGASGATLLSTVRQRLLDVGLVHLSVVTGLHHDVLADACAAWSDMYVSHNLRHTDGQLTSIWTLLDWVEALPHRPDWLLVALVDMPSLRADTLDRVVHTALRGEGTPWLVRPAVGLQHGHPVLWHREAWPRLREAEAAHGARHVVHTLVAEGRVRDVPVDDPGVLRDIDTPEDYAREGRG